MDAAALHTGRERLRGHVDGVAALATSANELTRAGLELDRNLRIKLVVPRLHHFVAGMRRYLEALHLDNLMDFKDHVAADRDTPEDDAAARELTDELRAMLEQLQAFSPVIEAEHCAARALAARYEPSMLPGFDALSSAALERHADMVRLVEFMLGQNSEPAVPPPGPPSAYAGRIVDIDDVLAS